MRRKTSALLADVKGCLEFCAEYRARIDVLLLHLSEHPSQQVRDMGGPDLQRAQACAMSSRDALHDAVKYIEQAEAWDKEGRS